MEQTKIRGGFGKPLFETHSQVPHHLIDIKNPDEEYSAAEFKKDALKAIRGILRRGKFPILAGGTGLYVKAVIDNLEIPAVKADQRLRKKLENEMAREGLHSIFQRLVKLDPEAAYMVDPKNPRRVIRALEVAIKTKKPFSAARKIGSPLFNALKIGVFPGKEILKKKIEARAEQMFKKGLVKEVGELLKKYGPGRKAFDAIGYREIIDYLEGKISLAEAKELIKKHTRGYAKRQMTWFKRDPEIHWIKDEKEAVTLTKNFLGNN